MVDGQSRIWSYTLVDLLVTPGITQATHDLTHVPLKIRIDDSIVGYMGNTWLTLSRNELVKELHDLEIEPQ